MWIEFEGRRTFNKKFSYDHDDLSLDEMYFKDQMQLSVDLIVGHLRNRYR